MSLWAVPQCRQVQLQGRDKATERIMKDLDSTFAKMRSEVDKDKVAASVRKEALGPTRDAIKVCSPDWTPSQGPP